MICIRCGHVNEHGVNYCQNCNAPMARMDMPAEVSLPTVEERFNIIRKACEKASSGEWTVEALTCHVQEILNLLTQKFREIQDLVADTNYVNDSPEEVEVGFAGMELYEQGLLELLAYAEKQDPLHLQSGLEMVRRGNEHINNAMRINRENRNKAEWNVWL